MATSHIAAVDLGSNSFRLQIAKVANGLIYPMDQLKQSVRLASGLLADKTLSQEAKDRAMEAVSLFGERLRGFSPTNVRVVATNTLRVAHDTGEFVAALEAKLGFPIEIISGTEEARLVYLGAIHSLPRSNVRRLIFDIGGGSTEFIIGEGERTLLMESIAIGCVSYSQFFPEGECSKKRLRAAQIAAGSEIESIQADCHALGWVEAYGTSGTASALVDLAEANGLNPDGQQGLSRQALESIKTMLLEAGSAQQLKCQGLRPDRIPVLAGGVAVMSGIFNTLKIEHIHTAEGALRLGVLYDMIGRDEPGQDQRQKTIDHFRQQLNLDQDHANAVAATAGRLFEQLTSASISLQRDGQQEALRIRHEAKQFLGWAAHLLEIGRIVSHISYHKHGAYFLTYADMPGFSRKEQQRMASLILAHRGKLTKVPLLKGHVDWEVILCLRLAVMLHRARALAVLPEYFTLGLSKTGYQLYLPAIWLRDHPLAEASLQAESSYWQAVGRDLQILTN